MNPMDQKIYTVSDLAKRFDVHKETVRLWCRNDKIEFIKKDLPNGRIYFTYDAVEKFYHQNYDRFIPNA